jgi:hypothetical protein
MKQLFFLLTAAMAFIACNDNDHDHKADETVNQDSINYANNLAKEKDTANFTTVQWLDSVFLDKGKIKEGGQLEVSWRFKNTGTKPLVVISAVAGCGCTTPEKPEQPVAPGEEGVIKAKFNSEGRPGFQQKVVEVRMNTAENDYPLTFKVEVLKK